ncbi:MAG: type II and III secretion system protein [Negativicutes bacterium]|nr:type II and III secretion system protein [Negativicutes bacterium]
MLRLKMLVTALVIWSLQVLPAGAAVGAAEPADDVPAMTAAQSEGEVQAEPGRPLANVDRQPALEVETSNGGRLLRVPITKNDASALTAAMASLQPDLPGITVGVVNEGDVQYLILSGQDPAAVENARQVVFSVLRIPDNIPRVLVNISAMLKEFSESEMKSVGLPIVPQQIGWTNTGYSGTYGYGIGAGATGPFTYSATLDAMGFLTWNLYNSDSIGKVLVASTIMAENGVTGTLNSTDNIAFTIPQSSSEGGGDTASSQTITTQVTITPTVMQYDVTNPANSWVRLDVNVQLSVLTQAPSGSGGVPFTQKNLTTTRIVRADGFPVIAGSFRTDSYLPQTYKMPVLGDIPLIKYFFSYEQTNIDREFSMLFLTVRLEPLSR